MSKKNVKIKAANTPKKTETLTNNNQQFVWGIILFLFTFLLYSNTLNHKFVLDDFGALADNWVVKKGLDGIPIILKTSYRFGINMLSDNLYRPLSQVMFAIEWQISPKNPFIHHFINVFFYALSIMLLFVVLKKFFSKINPLIPLMIALLYAVHPLHTEVVANIKSRDEIMSFFFLMCTLLALHKWFTKNSILALILGILSYFLAFMAKEGVITMLAVFPIMGWYFTSVKIKDNILSSILMILPAIAYMIIRSNVLTKFGTDAPTSVVDNFLSAAPDKVSYFATAIYLLGKYIWLLFIPTPLICDYSFNQIPIVGFGNIGVIISFLIYISLITLAFWLLRKKSPIIFGLILFLTSISIYSNILIPIGSSFAERFMFLPSLGFCIALVFIGFKLFKIPTDDETITLTTIFKKSPFFIVLFAVIVSLYSFKTVVRAGEWKDQHTLFGKDIKRAPNSAHLRYYWGLAIRDKALEEKDVNKLKALTMSAIEQFDKAIAIYPSYPDCYEQLGLAWYRVNNGEKALENYNKAIALNNTKAVTFSNIGIIYFEQGNYPKALELYSKALSLDSNYADAYFNMGSTLGMMGKYEEAIVNFKKCIHFDPENAKAHQFIGVTYKNLNQDEEAKPWFDKAAILEQKKLSEKSIK